MAVAAMAHQKLRVERNKLAAQKGYDPETDDHARSKNFRAMAVESVKMSS